jgi:hypothetical protein
LDATGGEEWDFTATDDGWTATNATISGVGPSSTTIVVQQDAANPFIQSPAITLTGGIYTQVVARVRQTISGGGWEGRVYYQTAAHGFNGSYFKAIPDPSLALSDWATLTWDMSALTAGGTDWEDSEIQAIRLDLGDTGAGRWEIDWIIIAKFSTTAISNAISALDVRVTTNEGDISSQATQFTLLESRVDVLDDPVTGSVAVNATAISGLTTDVGINTGDIAANAAAITALEVSKVDVNANAITQLTAEINTLDGVTTAQASSILQLSSTLTGGFASVVDPLTTAGQVFGSTITPSSIQAYSVGGRSGVAARIVTSGNSSSFMWRADDDLLFVDPYAVYEVKFRVYHQRDADNEGSFYFGMYATAANDRAGAKLTVDRIRNGAIVDSTNNPYWFHRIKTGGNLWYDVTVYLLGDLVDPATCPNGLVQGASTAGLAVDGVRIRSSAPWAHFRFLNYNGSPTYGDGTPTTVFFTNFSVERIDGPATFRSTLQQETSVLTSDVGDINATYAVRAELTAGGDPYVSGFGLMADVINGSASSAFGVRADKFFINNPGNPTDQKFPFVVDVVDGASTVGIRGELIVDGSIRGTKIFTKTLGADHIDVTTLDAFSADMGTLTSGLIRTADSPAYRVELEADVSLPIWFGKNAKTGPNARFYVNNVGDVYIQGLMDAGIIRQTLFTPATTSSNNPFRIACNYPSSFSEGNYTGKEAHLFPVMTDHIFYPDVGFPNGFPFGPGGSTAPVGGVSFLGPFHTSSTKYGRLGQYANTFHFTFTAKVQRRLGGGSTTYRARIRYAYNGGTFTNSTHRDHYTDFVLRTAGETFVHFSGSFRTRSTAFTEFEAAVRMEAIAGDRTNQSELVQGTFTVWTPNFGLSDATGIPQLG